MPESESGGSKKPPKSASPAAKPSRSNDKKPAKATAKKPATTAAKRPAKKPAKTAANPTKAAKPARSAAKAPATAAKPAARKPAAAKPAAGSKAGAATRKPTKVVSATPSTSAPGPAAAKKARAGTRSPTKAPTAPSPAKKPRSGGPKVTPAVAPPKPVSVAAEQPAAPVVEEAAPTPQKPAPPAATPSPAPPAGTAGSAAPPGSDERKVVQDTARGYFDALAARDADAAVAFWSPEGVDDILPLRILRGPNAIRACLHELFTAVPDMRFTVERVTADEKVAAVQWRSTGTFSSGTFEGLEPPGRRIELRGIDCLEVVDGKIVHNTGVFDGAAFARQVGLLPPEDSGTDRAIRAGFNTVTKLRRTVAKRTAR